MVYTIPTYTVPRHWREPSHNAPPGRRRLISQKGCHMRLAVISDIHGNRTALEAVLADAQKQNTDSYLFLGDYAVGYPWGNEVVSLIRSLRNAYAVRGNGEDYLAEIRQGGYCDFSVEQYKPVFWAYRMIPEDDLAYLEQLPTAMTLSVGSCSIYLNHSMELFYRLPGLFHPAEYNDEMLKAPFTHEEYLKLAEKEILSSPGAAAEMLSLPAGIYLFGHNHLQFHMEYEGRLFINPGSCGEPLDWETTAAYTLLEIDKDSSRVTERRVAYDIDSTADSLQNSRFCSYAPIWMDLLKRNLLTGKDYFNTFVLHMNATAEAAGVTDYPYGNDIWKLAVASWDADSIFRQPDTI